MRVKPIRRVDWVAGALGVSFSLGLLFLGAMGTGIRLI